jgi:hypothetical protein
MKRSLFVLIVWAATATGQPTIAVHLGGSVPFSETYSGLGYFHDDYWPVGVTAGIVYDVAITRWFRVLPGVEYLLFPLKSNFTFHGGYIATLGSPSGSGDGFHRLLLNLGCRVQWPSGPNIVSPFVEMDGAYLFERIGRTAFSFGPGHEEFVSERVDRNTWAFGFGLGSEVWVSNHLRIEPSMRYQSSLDDHLYGLFTINVVYTFHL